jgi:ligand-binding sensor domain-containing protein
VHADKYGFIWFSTDIALFKLDINTGVYEAIPVNKDEHSIPNYTVLYNGYLETEEGLWIFTGGGITFYDYKTQTYFHRYHNPDKKSIFYHAKRKIGDFQSDLEQDASGKMWFVLEDKYLARYDISTDQLDTFKLPIPVGTWSCCWSIGVDAHENIWVGTRHGGVLVFDTGSNTFSSLKDSGVNRLIQSDYIYSIEKGPRGEMFVAHDAGLDIIDLYDLSLQEIKLSDRNDFMNIKYQSGDMSFNEDESSVYIPFYHAGFFKYKLDDESLIQFEKSPYDEWYTSLIYYSHGKTYASSDGNLREIGFQEDSLIFTENLLLPDTLTHLRGQVVWCHIESPNSIYVKKSSGLFFHIHDGQLDAMSSQGFKPDICMSPDSQVLSYMTADENLVRINLQQRRHDTIDLQHYLQSLDFSFSNSRHIVDDGTSVWMTGQNGILRFNYLDEKLQSYGLEKGLSHTFTFSIVLDNQRNVWVGSIGGIDRYDRSDDRFVSIYKIKDNIYMDAFGHALCSKKGELFFNFGNKFVRLQPDLAKNQLPEKLTIQLNEVLVNGLNIDWKATQKLTNLRHDENHLTFVYDLLLYDDSEDIYFEYRLNGKEWTNNKKRNEVNLDGLGSGSYVLELRGSAGSMINATSPVSIPFQIHPPWWKEWWFILMICLSIVTALWIYFKERIDKFRKELLVTRQISELESKALRAQMNPHFVFNSLNAIQECIVTGRVEEAYSYLSKFSKLLRMVLEHSDVTEVKLQEELEVLGLYISLEKLRFKDDMQYRFHLDDELDAEEIYIPPMLIQPHIENAIWHGLRHKEGEKHLVLSITENPPGYLEVIIEDDGIGRKKSGEIRERRLGGNKHNSKGTQLSENRMELLRKPYPFTSLTIIDLYHPKGEASGTKVILSIPMLKKKSVNPNVSGT